MRVMRPGSRPASSVFMRAVLFGTAVLLSACSVLPKPTPLDVYVLPSASVLTPSQAEGGAVPWSLRITRPVAGVHIAGQRIVVVPEDNRISVYKGAGWSEPAPVLMRNRLLDAFRDDGRVGSLSSDEKRLHADFELDSDLRAFQSEYRNGRPEVVLRLDARLLGNDAQRIIASRQFEIRHPAADTNVPAVVRAFGEAADSLSAQVLAWVLVEADKVPPGKAAR